MNNMKVGDIGVLQYLQLVKEKNGMCAEIKEIVNDGDIVIFNNEPCIARQDAYGVTDVLGDDGLIQRHMIRPIDGRFNDEDSERQNLTTPIHREFEKAFIKMLTG